MSAFNVADFLLCKLLCLFLLNPININKKICCVCCLNAIFFTTFHACRCWTPTFLTSSSSNCYSASTTFWLSIYELGVKYQKLKVVVGRVVGGFVCVCLFYSTGTPRHWSLIFHYIRIRGFVIDGYHRRAVKSVGHLQNFIKGSRWHNTYLNMQNRRTRRNEEFLWIVPRLWKNFW